uniref:Uncharacterized protein n=1 Tax=Rhizophora mucronata TaxID=61149 RepID=A0A2P2QV17_RHIMU
MPLCCAFGYPIVGIPHGLAGKLQ